MWIQVGEQAHYVPVELLRPFIATMGNWIHADENSGKANELKGIDLLLGTIERALDNDREMNIKLIKTKPGTVKHFVMQLLNGEFENDE